MSIIRSNTSTITVKTPPLPSSITISPSVVSIDVGKTIQLTAVDQNGSPVTVQLTWVSNNPNIATVDSKGLVLGIAQGSVGITASFDTGTTTVNVVITVKQGSGNVDVIANGTSLGKTTTSKTYSIPVGANVSFVASADSGFSFDKWIDDSGVTHTENPLNAVQKFPGGLDAYFKTGGIPTPVGYHLVWQDEFDGNSLDLSKWRIHYGNASVSNSMLTLGPGIGEIGAKVVNGNPLFLFQYGWIETRLRFAFDPNNPAAQRRTHRTGPWLVGSYSSNNTTNPTTGTFGGEIDLTETASGPTQTDNSLCGGNKINTTVHRYPSSNPDNQVQRTKTFSAGFNFSDAFHVLALEWTPTYVRTLVDGNEVIRTTSSEMIIPEAYMFPLVGLCPLCWPFQGKDNGPCPSDTPTGNEIAQVDYVRIFQKN